MWVPFIFVQWVDGFKNYIRTVLLNCSFEEDNSMSFKHESHDIFHRSTSLSVECMHGYSVQHLKRSQCSEKVLGSKLSQGLLGRNCLNRQKKSEAQIRNLSDSLLMEATLVKLKTKSLLIPRSHYCCGTQMTEVKNVFQDETAQCLTPLFRLWPVP